MRLINCSLGLALALTAAACHHPKDFGPEEMHATPIVKPQPSCQGEPYLQIHNPTNQAVDIYAFVPSHYVYIGTAMPSTDRISLAGTAAENSHGPFLAQIDGKPVPYSGPTQVVSITRRCDKSP